MRKAKMRSRYSLRCASDFHSAEEMKETDWLLLDAIRFN